jgi:hypothetical protein
LRRKDVKTISIVMVLVVALGAIALGQDTVPTPAVTVPTPPAVSGTGWAWALGSGAGFKPYQTTIKAGSSGFVEGGWQFSPGLFLFGRIDMRATDAQMLFEGCKSVFTKPYSVLMLCGGPGFGADATNVGISLAAGGKSYFSPKPLQKQNAWIGVEVGVSKTTVPAPVSPPPGSTVVNPVQPEFRVGIFKTF